MKSSIYLLISFLIVLAIFIISPPVKAYDNIQLENCISGSKENSILDQVSESKIRSYCECALTFIVDERQRIRKAANKCALSNLN